MSGARPEPAAAGGRDRVGDPEVDLVIAVHTTQRPIARAVSSALDSRAATRVTVVCHDVDAALIDANLEGVAVPPGSSVRTVELRDGTRSPAGPFNHGLDLATAPYVAVMGSDDRLAPGAVDSWLALARRTGSAAVVARLSKADADGTVVARVPTPPARPFRVAALEGVRDRLCYRSAPLGLLERQALDALGLRFSRGHEVGEDIAFVTRLWLSGLPIAFDRRGPAYLVQDDAGDRITAVTRPVVVELAFLVECLGLDWFVALPLRARRAVAVKFLRIHVFGLVLTRTEQFWTSTEREALADVARALLQAAPGCWRVLSRADRALLRAIEDVEGTTDELVRRARARRRHGRPTTVLTTDLTRLLAREAPLRLMAASALARQ